jgi:hypothetical protein
MSVPTNLIPTPITGLPEYTGSSTLGYLPYILNGQTFKVQFTNIAAVGAVPSTRVIASGTGLAGGGDLSADRVISIAAGGVGVNQLSLTGVTAGTYGSGSAVPVLTVDATGRVTSATTAALSVTGFVPTSRTITAGNGLTGGGSLASDITLSANFSTTTPLALGSATAGVAITLSRGDHVHPALDLSDTNQTQGALPLGRGGTGDALSPVAGAVVYSTGTKFALSALGLAGQVLVSNGTSAPSWLTVSGTGTVTSVNASGGTTGLSFTGGPITAAGTLTLGGTLAIANGGTGATTLTSGYLVKGNGTSAVSASVVYDSGTNVGIGTTSPTAPLTVSAASVMSRFQTGTASDGRVEFAYNTTDIGYLNMGSASLLDLTARSGVALAFGAGGSERMRINSAGNVGIGTTAPVTALEVARGAGTASYISIYGNNGAASSLYVGQDTAGLSRIFQNGANPITVWTNSVERMRIDSSGNVGIGTSSPAARLDVQVTGGRFQVLSAVSTTGIRLLPVNAANSATVPIEISGTDIRFTNPLNTVVGIFDANGNLGIGTASPNASAILDVQSTTKGFRLPNMTTTQKNAISSPAAGLMVFDTTLAKACVYSGSAWQTITSI